MFSELLATYNATDAWDISLSGRYTSDSFNDLDNRDRVNNVFGAPIGTAEAAEFSGEYRTIANDKISRTS